MGRICTAAARATILGMIVGMVTAAVAGLLGGRFGLGTVAFTIVFYLAPPTGAAIGAFEASVALDRRALRPLRAAAVAGAFVIICEVGMVLVAWWLESASPGTANAWLAPTALLAPVVPAVLLSATGRILSRRETEDEENRAPARAWQTAAIVVCGALLGLPLGFSGAMSIGMLYAESIGTCSIGAIGHAMLAVLLGPLIGAWMGRWTAARWGHLLFRSLP
ncbi:MAG: hypothetical protein ACOX9R_15860 [Armatimonadota bacterium]|jgi:hypothetical protein